MEFQLTVVILFKFVIIYLCTNCKKKEKKKKTLTVNICEKRNRERELRINLRHCDESTMTRTEGQQMQRFFFLPNELAFEKAERSTLIFKKQKKK